MAESRPPPIPRKTKAPVRHKAGAMTPEQKLGKARVSASKLCNSSFICAILGCVFFFLPFLGGATPIAGAAAAVMGAMGLVGLAKAGRGPSNLEDASPIERVGARMARNAKGKGVAGLVIGLGIIALYVVMFLAAKSEQEQQQERMRQGIERFERQIEELRKRKGTDGK